MKEAQCLPDSSRATELVVKPLARTFTYPGPTFLALQLLIPVIVGGLLLQNHSLPYLW